MTVFIIAGLALGLSCTAFGIHVMTSTSKQFTWGRQPVSRWLWGSSWIAFGGFGVLNGISFVGGLSPGKVVALRFGGLLCLALVVGLRQRRQHQASR